MPKTMPARITGNPRVARARQPCAMVREASGQSCDCEGGEWVSCNWEGGEQQVSCDCKGGEQRATCDGEGGRATDLPMTLGRATCDL